MVTRSRLIKLEHASSNWAWAHLCIARITSPDDDNTNNNDNITYTKVSLSVIWKY
jgi:hypothetical protein